MYHYLGGNLVVRHKARLSVTGLEFIEPELFASAGTMLVSELDALPGCS